MKHRMKHQFSVILLFFATTLLGCGGGGGGGGSSTGGGNVGGGSTKTVSQFVSGSWLSGSRHIAFAGTDLYVANAGADNVIRVNAAGSHTSVLSIASPFGITAYGNDVYVTGTIGGLSKSYLVANGSSLTPTCNCYGVAFDGIHMAYADQTGVSINGVTTYPVKTFIGNQLYQTTQITSKPTGLIFYNSFLYVTRNESSTSGAIQKIDLSTNAVTDVAGSTLFNRPNAIAVNSNNGDFYVVNDGDGKVLKVSGGNVTVHLDSSHGLCSPGGVAVGGDGLLYVSNGACPGGNGNGFILKASL
jgi:DNA-binding beta-propeller fold protein YncE